MDERFSGEFTENIGTIQSFVNQPLAASMLLDTNENSFKGPVAPCVPMVLGTKRERLPDETVTRRSNLVCRLVHRYDS